MLYQKVENHPLNETSQLLESGGTFQSNKKAGGFVFRLSVGSFGGELI